MRTREMESASVKFGFRTMLLFLLFGLLATGCSKKSSPDPGPTTTTTNNGSGDPAQYGTPYASVPSTKDMVMYEVNPKTFSPANFQGVQARLDSIKALGVNVIWLMPTYPVGVTKSVGSPYSVKDYEGVNSSYGTLDDLRALVAKAHTLGMAVIMDWVANDTSWDNAWIQTHGISRMLPETLFTLRALRIPMLPL
jgi:glycosidase